MSLGYGFEAGDFAVFIQFADMIIGAPRHGNSRRSRTRRRHKLAMEQCSEFIAMMDDLQNLDFSDVPASLRRILDDAFSGTAADVGRIRAITQRPTDPSCLGVVSSTSRAHWMCSTAHDLAAINGYFLTRLHQLKALLLLEVLSRIKDQPMPDLSQDAAIFTNLYQNQQPTLQADPRFPADWNLLHNANHIINIIYGQLDFRHRQGGENVLPPPPANQHGDDSDGFDPFLPQHPHLHQASTRAGNEPRASAEVVWDMNEHLRGLNLNCFLAEAATIYTAAAPPGTVDGRMHPTLHSATDRHYIACQAARCIIQYAQVSSRLGVETGFQEDREITLLSRQFMKFSELQLNIANSFMTNPIPQDFQARVLDRARIACDKIMTWRDTAWSEMLRPFTLWRIFGPNERADNIKAMNFTMQSYNSEFDFIKSRMTTMAPAG